MVMKIAELLCSTRKLKPLFSRSADAVLHKIKSIGALAPILAVPRFRYLDTHQTQELNDRSVDNLGGKVRSSYLTWV
jgi:hypothetical protein